MTPKGRKDPFDVRLDDEQRRSLTTRLVNEIRAVKQARGVVTDDGGLIDFAYSLYEQQSQKGISRDTDRYGGADLTSPIATENVDTLSARATRTIFKQEPLWIVEGIGDSSKKEAAVEVFMQYRQEEIRLQKTAKRVVTAAFVEPGSIIEVCEDAERIVRHETVKAQIARHPENNSILLDAKTGKPTPALDPETGEPVKADEGSEDFVEVQRRWIDYRRRGATVRRRSMKDFAFLPAHAEDEREVWGHAHRFWMTLDDINRRRDEGEFEKDAVDLLGGDTMERMQSPEADRQGVQVTYVPGFDTAEKELWKIQIWADFDGTGMCFYTAIVSELHAAILTLKYDWLQRFRTVYVNPYPCPYSVYGYSLVLTKLLTTIEEHTAWRNMNADRGTLKSNAPIKRLHGAQWDPTIQPFGAGQVIDVASMNEIQPFEFEDVSNQAMVKEGQCPTDAQRIVGVNDIALAQTNSQSRTLGENQMATQQSFVRTDDPVSNIQEAFEEVGEIMHAIEVQALREMGAQGMQAPASVTQKLQYASDTSFDGTFTADMIDGQFRFKPRGSTDEADPHARTQRREAGIMRMMNLAKVNPLIAQRMQSQEFADAMMQDIVDEMKPRDKAAFLKPLAPPQPSPGMPVGAPGAIPGMPPPGAAPSAGAPPFGQQVLAQALQHLPQHGAVQ